MNEPRKAMNEHAQADRGRTAHEHLLADLKALLDGELTPVQVWSTRAHLWFCPSCREEVVWLKRLGEDMRDLERAVPSPRLRARILAALPDPPPGRLASTNRNRGPWLRLAPAPAFAALGEIACATAAYFALIPKNASHPLAGAIVRRADAMPLPVVKEPARDPAPSHPLVSHQGVPAPDRYNRYADRVVEQWEKDQVQRESREMAKNRTGFAKLLSAVRSIREGSEATETMRLSLAVADVKGAAERLQSWAKAVGGEVTAQSHGSQSQVTLAPLINTTEQPSRTVAYGANTAGRYLTLRVPASRVASLEPVLLKVGAWRTAGGKFGGTRATVGNVTPKIPQPSKAEGQAAATPASPAQVGGPAAIAGSGPSGYSNQAVGRDGSALVTLQIQLTNLDAPVP